MVLEKLGAQVEIEAAMSMHSGEGADRRRDPFSQGDGRRHPYRTDGASAARGQTLLVNAAREPEIIDLAIASSDGREDQGRGNHLSRSRASAAFRARATLFA